MAATIRAAMASARVNQPFRQMQRIAEGDDGQSDKNRKRAEHIVGEMLGVRSQRAAGMTGGGPPQSPRTKKVDHHGDDQDGERPDANRWS